MIDALGEIHLDYEPELLDAIRASGLRGCIVTVGNPVLHEPRAFQDLRAELEALSRLGPVASLRWPFFIAELNHPRRMETVAEGLRRRGYRAGDVERIPGGNVYRLLRETIGCVWAALG